MGDTMKKIKGKAGHPRCGCTAEIRAIRRQHSNETWHWWLRCTACDRLGSQAVKEHSIHPDDRLMAQTEVTDGMRKIKERRARGEMNIFGPYGG